MADLLFTHSYFLRFDPKEYRAMMPYPPLGTLYAAAVARRAGHDVRLFDAMLAESEEDLIPYLSPTPDWLIIYDDDFNYLTKMCLTRMRRAAFRMIEMALAQGTRVIVHGSDATDHAEEYLNAGASYVLKGEAEMTLEAVLGRLDEDPAEVAFDTPGAAALDREGELVTGGARPPLRDLDSLPMPARDLVDIDRYRRAWVDRHGYFSMNLATTRGCPFHCNWCAKPLYGQVYHSHSPARIADEVAEIKRLYSPDHLWICDDIFGLKPKWIERFAEELERRDAIIPFKALSRADLLLRGDTVRDLAEAGCQTIWIGAESGAQSVLDAMDKGTTIEQIAEARDALGKAGIRTGFFLQYGYPGERMEEISATLSMVRRLVPEEIGISVSYPLPGTKFYERVRAEMSRKQNWEESADLAMMFHGTYGTEFYRLLARFTHFEHRLHLGLRSLRALIRDRALPSRSELRRILLMPVYLAARTLQGWRMRATT